MLHFSVFYGDVPCPTYVTLLGVLWRCVLSYISYISQYLVEMCPVLHTVSDLISEHALISGHTHPFFLRSCPKKNHLCNVLSSYFKCFNYMLSCPSTKFNLLMWHFFYTVHVFFLYIWAIPAETAGNGKDNV